VFAIGNPVSSATLQLCCMLNLSAMPLEVRWCIVRLVFLVIDLVAMHWLGVVTLVDHKYVLAPNDTEKHNLK
jgi:hypothetical protein